MTWRSLTALMTILAVAAVACGEGESSDPSAGETSSGEFASELDSLCVETTAEAVDALAPVGGPRVAPDFQAQLEQTELTLPVRRDAVEQLGSLEPPAELESDWQAYVGAQEDLLAAGEQAIEAGRQGDQQGYDAAFEQVDAAQQESRDAAAALGADACAGEVPAEDEKEIEQVITVLATELTPNRCTELFTEAYVESTYDDEARKQGTDPLAACERFQRTLEPSEQAEDVELGEMTGPPPRVIVPVTVVGGPDDGQEASFTLVEEGGGWAVNDVAFSD